jgi:amidophosphoribosyltransferase
MTNSAELFNQLIEYGLNLVGDSDTQVVLERLGYFLDLEHRHLRATMGPESLQGLEGRRLAEAISHDLDITKILTRASEDWDGGYAFAGLLGNGDAFVCRDPAGIRPLFFYEDDDVLAAASERPPLMSVFNAEPEAITSVAPGHVLSIKKDGRTTHQPFTDPLPLRQCTFERIYFSRGNDPDIYEERKQLGRNLAGRVLDSIDHDVEHAVFSFIPNTAETAFLGLVGETQRQVRTHRAEAFWASVESGTPDKDAFRHMNAVQVRAEKIAHKDQRLRTFITHDAARRDLVMHIYDITRDVVRPEDTLVVLDDSIVRGTTLRESIITILSRLNPKKIIIASSAPPIQYPDCYGIDMSHLHRFIAFQAAIELLKDEGRLDLLDAVEHDCRQQADAPPSEMVNHVRRIYDPFSLDMLSNKIAELIRPDDVEWDGELQVIYQDVDGLRAAMPEFSGDWYFTGDYPTPGGMAVLNQSYLNWRAGLDTRAY